MMDSNLSRKAKSIFSASYINKMSCVKLACHCIVLKTTFPVALNTPLKKYWCASPFRLGI